MSDHVVILAMGYPPKLGGVETYSEAIALEYLRRGRSVTVITRRPATPRGWSLEHGLRVFNVGDASQARVALRMTRALLALRSSADQRIDSIHATTWRVGLPCLIVARDIPLTLTVHGREVLATGSSVMRQLMDRVFSAAKRIVVISRFSADRCIAEAYRGKTRVAWNGASDWARQIDASPIVTAVDRPLQVLCAARFVERKNVHGAISAFARLVDAGYQAELTLAGDGPMAGQLKELASSLGLGNRLRFAGHVRGEALVELHRKADIFLHPHSHSHDSTDVESFCLAVADAMAAGIPVISGRDGAPSEYIDHGRNGLLVDGASVENIAEALIALASDAQMRLAMGQEAREFARANFSWATHLDAALGA